MSVLAKKKIYIKKIHGVNRPLDIQEKWRNKRGKGRGKMEWQMGEDRDPKSMTLP